MFDDFDLVIVFNVYYLNLDIWLHIDQIPLYVMRFILMMINVIIFFIIFNYVKFSVFIFIISLFSLLTRQVSVRYLSLALGPAVLEPDFHLQATISG